MADTSVDSARPCPLCVLKEAACGLTADEFPGVPTELSEGILNHTHKAAAK